VLARWRHLEAIPASEANWDVAVRGASKLAATLQARMPDALLYRDLATLRTDADIPQSLEELEWRGAHRGPFVALCEELGFGGMRNRPRRWAD
jgi:hypothetical protein